eukprot:4148336-Prymnesium_polylepis.2
MFCGARQRSDLRRDAERRRLAAQHRDEDALDREAVVEAQQQLDGPVRRDRALGERARAHGRAYGLEMPLQLRAVQVRVPQVRLGLAPRVDALAKQRPDPIALVRSGLRVLRPVE